MRWRFDDQRDARGQTWLIWAADEANGIKIGSGKSLDIGNQYPGKEDEFSYSAGRSQVLLRRTTRIPRVVLGAGDVIF